MEMEWKWVINKQDSKVLALPFTTHKPHPKEYGVAKEIKTKMSHWEQLGEKFQMIRQYKDQSDLYINSRTFAVSTLPVPREFKGTLMRFIDVKVAWTSREQIIPNPPRTPTAVGYNSSKYGKTHVLFEMGVMRKVWRDITSWGRRARFWGVKWGIKVRSSYLWRSIFPRLLGSGGEEFFCALAIVGQAVVLTVRDGSEEKHSQFLC